MLGFECFRQSVQVSERSQVKNQQAQLHDLKINRKFIMIWWELWDLTS